jgi:macrodomain Ter protein organizer (MatP/YcbG family)
MSKEDFQVHNKSIRLPKTVWHELYKEAGKRGIAVSALINVILYEAAKSFITYDKNDSGAITNP